METTVSMQLRAARAAAAVEFLYERALEETGCSVVDYELLEAIARRRAPASVSTLARELGVKRTSLSRVARVLEAQGLVARQRRGTRTFLRLTATGANALAVMRERCGVVEARIRERLGEEGYSKALVTLILLTDPELGVCPRVAPLKGEFVKPTEIPENIARWMERMKQEV